MTPANNDKLAFQCSHYNVKYKNITVQKCNNPQSIIKIKPAGLKMLNLNALIGQIGVILEVVI